ncbi:TonB-dependent receptor domain-containing protein [Alteraurantiacibacter aquimixticola]|nr:TonB-dependent receptor [Alteraurantiacibacter aquimixticola]
MGNKARLGIGTATCAIALVLASQPAYAQDSDLDEVVEQENTIVVTGSRILRRDFEANSPIVTVDQSTIENRSAVGIEDTLNELPQFVPAGSDAIASSAGTAFSGANAAPGAATVNLRGIGTNRTLVLVNGRRAQPVNAALLVDLNTIPTAAIENVEVITGGAAAVYGADAIAGVVNFILRDDFEGIELSAQAGITEQGDGETYQGSALVGGNFADGNGNAMIGATWSKREEALQRNRDFYTDAWADPATQAGTGGRPLTVVNVSGTNYGINYDGSLFNPDNAADSAAPYNGPLQNLAGGAGYKLNPASPSGTRSLGYIDPEGLINIPLTRWSIFGSAHYDFNDSLTFFVESRFTHSEALAQSIVGTAQNFWALTVPYDAANDDPDSPTFGANQQAFHPVSPELADALNGTGQTSWTAVRGLNFAGRLLTETTSDIFQLTAGLRGDLPVKDWSWEIYGSHGNTSVLAQQPQGAISHDNIQQILQGTVDGGAPSITIDGPYGAGWSNGAIFNPQTCTSGIGLFNADGSVPAPLPGQAEGVAISEDCLNYITLELNNITQVKQNIVEATVQGGLVDLWAGEVRFALGATYRDASLDYKPDTGNSAEQVTVNVVNQIVLPAQTFGKTDVKEAFAELLVPVLSDVPLVNQFNLELGGRVSDYKNSGSVWTFKVLGDWEVTDWFRIRGGFQRANRAPNLYEQFAPIAGSIGASRDACLNIEGFTSPFGNRPDNPNQVNVQVACEELILRDGGFDYVTLAEDPNAIAQDPADYPNIDLTRLSNLRTSLAYNINFPFSIGLTQGNPDLDSEVADTITVGAVINSPFDAPLLDRFSLSIDYYNIDLSGTIAQPTGTEIYSQCFDPQFNPAMASAPGSLSGAELLAGNPYCDLIIRYPFDLFGNRAAPESGTDRTYRAQFINKGGTKTSGIDVALNWMGDLRDMGIGADGSLSMNLQASFLLNYEESSFEGADFVDYTGTLENQSYDYKLFGSLSYMWDNGSIGIRGRYLPSIDPSPFAGPGTLGTDSYAEFALFGRYNINEALEVRAGIDNLFDIKPRIVGADALDAARGSTIQTYDTLGRRYYMGVRYRM